MVDSDEKSTVTVIITQRERFGMTAESLDSLFAHTPPPFELVYVDGNSPKANARYLQEQSKKHGFLLERFDHFLTPNQARNIGLKKANTDYVVFVDNDVLYTDGWLNALIKCAEETNADIVAPLICQGLPAHTQVHHAGGNYTDSPDLNTFFETPEHQTERSFIEDMIAHGEELSSVEQTLKRKETGFCEFHCVLARRSVFEQIGALDENMLSTKEHIDFSMSVRKAGGKVWFEPQSIVTYVFPCREKPLTPSDWPYFALRWSDLWGKRTLTYFHKKWRLALPDDYLASKKRIYKTRRKQGIVMPMLYMLPFVKKNRNLVKFSSRLLSPIERAINYVWVKIFENLHPNQTEPTAKPSTQ